MRSLKDALTMLRSKDPQPDAALRMLRAWHHGDALYGAFIQCSIAQCIPVPAASTVVMFLRDICADGTCSCHRVTTSWKEAVVASVDTAKIVTNHMGQLTPVSRQQDAESGICSFNLQRASPDACEAGLALARTHVVASASSSSDRIQDGAEQTALEPAAQQPESVIEFVEHDEPAAVIPPPEASSTQHEVWASGVAAFINGAVVSAAPAASEPRLLLLTFARLTKELDDALLASAPAQKMMPHGDVKPDWAEGAKIFAVVDKDAFLAALPTDTVLKPWHVVLYEDDEVALFTCLNHLEQPARRLKHEVGRLPLNGSTDSSSTQANADNDRMIPDIEVMRTFIHFPQSHHVRSHHTV